MPIDPTDDEIRGRGRRRVPNPMVKHPMTFRPDQMGLILEVAEAEQEGVFARAVRSLIDEALAARAARRRRETDPEHAAA